VQWVVDAHARIGRLSIRNNQAARKTKKDHR